MTLKLLTWDNHIYSNIYWVCILCYEVDLLSNFLIAFYTRNIFYKVSCLFGIRFRKNDRTQKPNELHKFEYEVQCLITSSTDLFIMFPSFKKMRWTLRVYTVVFPVRNSFPTFLLRISICIDFWVRSEIMFTWTNKKDVLYKFGNANIFVLVLREF